MEPPPGGPADSKKPFVAAIFPPPDTTSMGVDLQGEIEFSEWVHADAGRNKVYINPPLATPIKTKLSGKRLSITCKSQLSPNTTYTLGVLGSIKDLNGLPLESPFAWVFSTGNKIDSGTLSGRMAPYLGKPSLGFYAALYPHDSTFRQNFQHLKKNVNGITNQPNPLLEAPAYIVPADSLGRFVFHAIKPGRYGLLGFQDINANLKPNFGIEAMAIGPTLEISKMSESKTLTLSPYDTVPLKLVEAKWIGDKIRSGKLSEGFIRLKFNRQPHPLGCLSRDNYRLEKISKTPIPILDVNVHPVTGDIELFTSALEIDSTYLLTCPGIKDEYGKRIDSARGQSKVVIGQNLDTAKTEFIFFGPRKINGQSEKIIPDHLIPSHGLALYTSKLLSDSNFADLKNRFFVKLDTTLVSSTLNRSNPHVLSMQFSTIPLKGQRLQFSLKSIDSLKTGPKVSEVKKSLDSAKANPVKKDSVNSANPSPTPIALPSSIILATFTLADQTHLGSLPFSQHPSAFGSTLVLYNLTSPTEFSRRTPPQENFIWDSLPEGNYSADYFRDANGDGIWNPGSLSPWTVEEPMVHLSDSLEVKSPATKEAEEKAIREDSNDTIGEKATKNGAKKDMPVKKLAWPPIE